MAGMREAIAAGRFAEFPGRHHGAMAAGRYSGGVTRDCLARPAWLKAAYERASSLSRQAPQAAFQAAAGQLRRPLPRVRAGRQVSLCAEPALHAGRRAEGNAGGAARPSRHRPRRDRAGELPRHRQCGDARLPSRRIPNAIAASPSSTTASPTPTTTGSTAAACAACASISSSTWAARPTWPCSTGSSTASRAAAGMWCCISMRPTSCRCPT